MGTGTFLLGGMHMQETNLMGGTARMVFSDPALVVKASRPCTRFAEFVLECSSGHRVSK